MTPVVVKEAAIVEVNAWLDMRRVRPSVRANLAANIEMIVEAVMYGCITIDPSTGVITQTLYDPIKDVNTNAVVIDKLEYKTRLTMDEIEAASKAGSDLAVSKAVAAALTGKAPAIFGKIQSSDFAVMASIQIFFTS